MLGGGVCRTYLYILASSQDRNTFVICGTPTFICLDAFPYHRKCPTKNYPSISPVQITSTSGLIFFWSNDANFQIITPRYFASSRWHSLLTRHSSTSTMRRCKFIFPFSLCLSRYMLTNDSGNSGCNSEGRSRSKCML